MRALPAMLVAFVLVSTLAGGCGSSDESTFPSDLSNGSIDSGNQDTSIPPLVPPTFDSGTGESSTPLGPCVPRTCQQANANCGPVGDGCGGLIQCGTCNAPESCGGGGEPSKCGGGFTTTCAPRTCTTANADCGPVADGCGGLLDCGTCTAPATCGGGSVASKCGGTTGCVPKNCIQLNANCGLAGDGCGGVLDCGNCAPNESCGLGGQSRCGLVSGGGSDAGADGGGNPNCTPKTCQQLGANCGPMGDGCGNLLNCGTCTAPQTCGGGGTASVCGGTSGCVAKTCAQAGANCGPVADGCGGVIQCGTCTAPQTCGGGGTPSVCGGTSACVPITTCAQANANCGPVADGCGGTLSCGTCTSPDICGGGGVASQCGGGTPPVDSGTCTGLCPQQVRCDGGTTTTVSGTVYAPTTAAYLPVGGKPDPIYNAVVYVPNAPLQAFSAGVSCTQCGADVSGTPLVKAFTGPDGQFVLSNVPVGTNIPLVIQLGRWRRVITIPTVQACRDNALTQEQTRLPRWQGEGSTFDNIPLTAIATGKVDTLECVLRKIGIDDREFTNPSGTGRVRLYKANGARINGSTPSSSNLVGSATVLDDYDLTVFSCEGSHIDKSSANQQRLIDYANAGGRVFTTHFSYTWLYDEAPFSTTGTWNIRQTEPNDPLTGNIDTSFPKGAAFAEWLRLVGALSNQTPPRIAINDPRHDLDAVNTTNAQRWIYSTSPSTIQHYTFNTPVGAAPENQCGRVIFSDFHVANIANATNVTFPQECQTSPLTAQEKVLEFMLFDLASCIEPDNPPPPPSCTPRTCQQANANCGAVGDGCGNILNCGDCTPPQTCGGGGPNLCGGQGCTPRTCQQAGAQCGPIGDGCGNQLNCGSCVPPQTCGGGGVPSQCGNPSCIAKTCAQQGIACGPAGDGCGGQLNCGDCTEPQTCGGGGSPGVCGNATCTPTSCIAKNAECGPIADGCGGLLQCGNCPAGQVCGGGGQANRCGSSSCNPQTCQAQSINCGPAGDGCGGRIECGPCTEPGQTCGGGGTAGQCGRACTPLTCQSIGADCGPAGDGCGGVLDCGVCTAPDTCGGGGVSFKCGRPIFR